MFGTCNTQMEAPLIDTAWSILEAANDLRDWSAVAACRRVIDESLRGRESARSDLKTVFCFFD
jgi:hypothetical protein